MLHSLLYIAIPLLYSSQIIGYFPGASAELAASRKCEKYANLPNSYISQPIAFDLRESTFLFQRLAITLQRFNSVLLRESFVYDLDK